MNDRELEQEYIDDDGYEGVRVVDAKTGRVLFEQRVRKGIDPLEFAAAMYGQFGIDVDEVQESMDMSLKDIKRELGEDTTSRYRVD